MKYRALQENTPIELIEYFLMNPESFLLNVSTQKHIPHKEGIGNDGVMIGDSYTEVGLVGP